MNFLYGKLKDKNNLQVGFSIGLLYNHNGNMVYETNNFFFPQFVSKFGGKEKVFFKRIISY